MAMAEQHRKIPVSLFILRISIALFLAPWVVEKFTQPETTAKIFAHFYRVNDLPVMGSYVIGVLWALLLLAFVTGFKKRISYGLVMVLHGCVVLATWKHLLPFLESYNHLFLASIPALGAMITLYALRDLDDKWSFS
ncbi:MAG: hypothetical protein COA43_09315 [Robiginitomaculum sp.]|nr:MAG: hypothetical protein COA43_09315 [Robiginitomaculum sp.]